MTTKQKINLIQEGFELIKSQKGYNQSKVVAKLEQLGYSTTTSTFSKIKNNKEIGIETITMVLQGMMDLMKKEMCLSPQEMTWKKLEKCTPEIVPIAKENDTFKGFEIYTSGRLKIEQKVDFFNTAQKEVYEFGITLNTFSSYLVNRNPNEFEAPLLALLKKGVDFKCFLMDPNWKGTSMYFEDRNSAVDEGTHGIDKIKGALRKLKKFSEKLESLELEGKFEVYQYRHFPSNYFLVVDNYNNTHAKMMVSNYLFGLHRALNPVMEFKRSAQPILYSRYLESLEQIIKKAKKVDFEKI